ncbi:PIN domain-containing protein [Paenibacillus hexagrammi]|uniref:PIN domain-containing protein n=1 Tax=Paenibacillus hexagrammi TaxID=2908839 RepID=A0ABY3SGU5_9BACL|nr:PIN domain-containing protein [Paenibacillus sp. YPD9-1]UJF32625.1 PIN domain-containing protein [Paenibacillus sp. YPD9-1]
MSRGYLLDTNIAIAILINEKNVIDFIKQAARDKMSIYFSTITECEVFAGLKPEEQLRAEKLFTSRRCLEVTSESAKLAGIIRREQKAKRRKLKTPDAIIIATAMVNELTLLSRDSDMNFVQNELGVSLIKI